ncbi:unnamed protein product, partial [Oppiella nova]
MDVVGASFYGINIDSLNNPDQPIERYLKRIFSGNGTFSQAMSSMAPTVAKWLGLEFFDTESTAYLDALTDRILRERKHNNKYTNSRRTDFVQLMIDSEKSNRDLGYNSSSDIDPTPEEESQTGGQPKGTLTYGELIAHGMSLFVAGYDTASSTMIHSIFYLSTNMDCQTRLFEELSTCNEFTNDTTMYLKYLNAVIHETLRLAPPLTLYHRVCRQDYKLGDTGIIIPKGTNVEIFPYALHRDPDYWPNPDDFIPDRWFEPTHTPYAYIPFGGGPRVCLGQRFAMNEMRMCLAKLFSKYEFTLAQPPGLIYGYNV